MSAKIRKRAAADVPTPTRLDVVELFFDTDDVLKFKDNKGVVRTAISVAGSPVSLAKQNSAPASAADKIKLYAKLASGNLEAFVRDNNGNEIQLTSDGASAAESTPGVFPRTQIFQEKLELSLAADEEHEFAFQVTPPSGQWCYYLAEFVIVGSVEQYALSDYSNTMLLLFDDSVGTPDARFLSYVTFRLADPSVTPLNVFNLSVDSAGVVTFDFKATNSSPVISRAALTVSGPYVFPRPTVPFPS